MRISLNLSTSSGPRERYALAWAVPIALVALVCLLLLARSVLGNFSEYRRVHRDVVMLQEEEGRIRYRETTLRAELGRPQFSELFRATQFVNTLIDKKQFSLTELTAEVAELLPAQVRLAGFALAQPGSEPIVRFTVVGNNEEAVETFLSNLEDSPDFKDVAIVNEGFEEGSGAAGPVTIACTARYVGGQPR